MSPDEKAALARAVGALIDERVTELKTTYEKRIAELEARQLLKGDPGEPGKDGKDGLGIENMSVHDEGPRGILIRFMRDGHPPVEFRKTFPAMIYQGVFKNGETYERGDMVTWGGSLWHANETTTEGPREGNKAWTLAAKKGRDGKDGQKGKDGLKGDPGPRGRDLTQMAPDGTKYA